jgi:H+/Cl- antiporter ClcA
LSAAFAENHAREGDLETAAIILVCICSAMIYGVVHDQITARICVEYFTIGHPPVFDTDSPTWLGIGWGIIATWWAGLLLGIPLSIAARAGSRPRRCARSLLRPISRLLIVMAFCAFLAGIVGYVLGRRGAVLLLDPLASQVPSGLHARFLADLWAHSASYLVGFAGGIAVIVRVWRSRSLLGKAED